MGRDSRSTLVDINDVEILKNDGFAAYLVRTSSGKEVWIPKSLCELNDDGSLRMEQWVAEDKELV